MLNALFDIGVFSAKAMILVILFLILLIGIVSILSRGKEARNGRITIKNINEKYLEIKETFLEVILSKKGFKQFHKENKRLQKTKAAEIDQDKKNVFILNFIGDIKASQVTGLREEITAVLNVAKPTDEVVVRLESAGGLVHAYGLAAAQLLRLREHSIPLTVIVDKVAASGGYLMACVADKIIAAPFAIIGSIGVVVQLPNFHRLLKEKNIDFEQLTAGNYKRTLSLFGENTEEGREKLHQEIEQIHLLFKELIHDHRKEVNIEQVATGEHWLAKQAIDLNLVDILQTSDDYLLSKSKEANLYEVCYQMKKSFAEKLFSTA